MIDNKKILAVIPARGGSKRLLRKNVLDLGGKPLIGWTINAALRCTYIDRVIVSTEDSEIAKIATVFGADIPFLRPKKMAEDDTSTVDLVLGLLDKVEEKNSYYDYIIVLQPTSPLRTTEHIEAAFEQLIKYNQSAIVSVCHTEHHPFWCNTLNKDRSMSSFLQNDMHNVRSQNLPDYYRLNGAIYICDINKLKTEKTFLLSRDCMAFIMENKSSIDIDTIDDFNHAQVALDNDIFNKSKLYDLLANNYLNKEFGKLSNKEFDLLMFDLIVRCYCLLNCKDFIISENLSYSKINKDFLYDLSTKLNLSKEELSRIITDMSDSFVLSD